jgi:hypothetical protein
MDTMLDIGSVRVGIRVLDGKRYCRTLRRMGHSGRDNEGMALQLSPTIYLILIRETADFLEILAHEANHVAEWAYPGKRQGERRAGLAGEIVSRGAR